MPLFPFIFQYWISYYFQVQNFLHSLNLVCASSYLFLSFSNSENNPKYIQSDKFNKIFLDLFLNKRIFLKVI